MYEEYWKLKDKPFENTPDPRFLYHSAQHEEGLYRLLYAVKEQKGAAIMTGVFGCGKTLLGRTMLKELGKDIYRVGYLSNPQMSYIELLMAIATSLGVSGLPTKKTEVLTNVVLNEIEKVLGNNMKDGRKTVVIIDEAHVINDREVWEGLRLVLNYQLEDRFLLTLLLLGQPELKENIDSNKQLAQRIAIRCHLGHMNQEDAHNYVLHRLKIAGREEPLFTEDALKAIYAKSGGIPRRINHICDLALLTGFGRKITSIDGHIISEVTKDLEGV
ncbi:MAG: AAA family ATPase [Candidatus Omnitrophota bacterium]